MGNIQKWGSYDIEAAKEEQEQVGKGAGGFMKLEQGNNRVRFLPPPVGKRTPFVLVQQHFVQMPVMSAPASFNCPRAMASERCPVCDRADKLKASGNPADFDEAKKLFPRLRVFANVIDRKHPEQGPQVLAYGKMVHEKLVKLRTDEDAGGDFTHPESGFDIIIERSGSGQLDTKYEVRPARQSSPLGDLEWIDMQQDLSRFAKVPTPEELAQILSLQPTGGRVSGGARQQGGSTAMTRSGGGKRTADADAYDADE
jgi:hypothetical protein